MSDPTTPPQNSPPRLPPTLDEIERLAMEALKTIPDLLARHIQGVVIRVEDFCDAETEDALELDSPFDLLGLYRGVSLPLQSSAPLRTETDMIFLYRRPLLDYWCETGEALEDVVRHVLIHEVGHHFGFSDADMERIEAED